MDRLSLDSVIQVKRLGSFFSGQALGRRMAHDAFLCGVGHALACLLVSLILGVFLGLWWLLGFFPSVGRLLSLKAFGRAIVGWRVSNCMAVTDIWHDVCRVGLVCEPPSRGRCWLGWGGRVWLTFLLRSWRAMPQSGPAELLEPGWILKGGSRLVREFWPRS